MNSLDRKQITLRLKKDISDKASKKAISLGLSLNAYITMVIAKECQK